MAGLRKAKKYDWKDSNMALFGSDTEKQVKKESAESEPAWQGAGQEVGLQIWRIMNFEVTEWKKEEYGSFYDGDSYIILNTYQEPDTEEFLFDVHFWIGKHSTQDEYGTAAYKTVELDTLLDDRAVQHREVMGHESDLFKSYFPHLTTQRGGAESGFRHVTPEEYTPRLLHFSGQRKHIVIREVPLNKDILNSGDVYILDMGLKLYQWNGKECSKDEKFKAMQYLVELKSERGNADSETLDEEDTSSRHEFFDALTEEVDETDSDSEVEGGEKKLFRVSEEMEEPEEVKTGDVSLDDFCSDDVFLYDSGKEIFVWVGSGASEKEKKNGIPYAHKYLQTQDHTYLPVTVVKEGQKNAALEMALTA